MELSRRTWIAAVKLAVVMSMLAAGAAIAIASVGEVSDTAVVATVAVIAFTASWVQTGRVRRTAVAPIKVFSHS